MVMLTKAEVLAVRKFGPAYETLWQDVQAVADAQEGVLPIEVERALYALGDAMPGATWSAYAAWIEERLASMGTESGQ